MIRIILYLFLIGHMLGDFYLQSSELAKNKDKSLKELIKHCIWYLGAMMLVIVPLFSWAIAKWTCIIAITHFAVDLVKFWLKGRDFVKGKEAMIYVIDQILHIFVIVIVSWGIYCSAEQVKYINFVEDILSKTQVDAMVLISWLLIVIIVIRPASVTIRTVLDHYRPESNAESNVVEDRTSNAVEVGIPNAGALIGILERGLILVLLFAGQYSAIGFVLTAKSVARYNKIAEDPKFSEYYLLGTLLSTLLVIATYFMIFGIKI